MPSRSRLPGLLLAAGLLTMALLPASGTGQTNLVPGMSACEEHPPIRITEDAGWEGFVLGIEFAGWAAPLYRPGSGVTGGLGTAASPYVIEDLCITRDADPQPTAPDTTDQPAAIHIANTDAHVVVRDNQLPAKGEFETGVRLVDAENVRVDDNDIVANTGDGVAIEGGKSLEIAGNRIEENGNDAVNVDGAHSADVVDNEIRANGGAAVRYQGGSLVATAEGNTVQDNAQGIILSNVNEIKIAANDIEDSGMLDAIQLYNADNNYVEDNRINSTPHGIGLFVNSDGNTITGNTVEKANGNGIEVSYSTENEIRDNRLEANEGVGIYLVGDAGTTAAKAVTGNELVANKAGLSLEKASATKVRDNTIEANANAGLEVSELASPLDARENWWGHSTGPSGGVTDACNGATVADGSGQAIDRIDGAGVCFDPWLTSVPDS